MWIHEGFTNYSETLFTEYYYGKQAGNEYNVGIRKGIRNNAPITPAYHVNAQGSGDMYPKAGNMLHAIRHSLDDDSLFRRILQGLNKRFYHQTVDAAQVEAYISRKAGYDYSKVFQQYLTTTQVPQLDFYFEGSALFYRYSNCIAGFNLPIVLGQGKARVKVIPSMQWQHVRLNSEQVRIFTAEHVEFLYYLKVVRTQ